MVLPETAKILINFFTYISAKGLVECGGLRVCELNPPHSAGGGGVGRPSVKNHDKNLPEQECYIPTGRAKAAALDPGLGWSPPCFRHFFD